MKDSSEKSSSTTSATTHQSTSQPFFVKAGGGGFFAPDATAAPAVQMKMAVSKPGEKLEQGADKVMRMSAPIAGKEEKLQRQPEEKLQKKGGDTIQKAAMSEEKLQKKEEDKLHKAPATEEKLQRKGDGVVPAVGARPATEATDTAPASVARVLVDSGRPLAPAFQQDMEQRFGHDFSRVRVHSGGAAGQSAQDINAHAYTVGHDIVFGAGQFAPETSGGQRLIAHELTHVVQQTGVSADTRISPAPLKVARVGGWKSDPKVGTWNKDSTTVVGVQRIPIEGLTEGYQKKDPSVSTAESADQRAIAVVPSGVDFTKNVDILLHFHGMNIGYRERSDTHVSSGPKGTVRDVEADQIEQQLAATSYKNLIAILPEGNVGAKFRDGTFKPDAYLNEALTKLGGLLGLTDAIKRGKLIFAGHSGGGPEAVHSADMLNPSAVADQNDPFKQDSPLLLFDGINGVGELATVKNLIGRWIDNDVARCTALGVPKAATELQKRGLHLRSTYSNSDVYRAVNVGGTFTNRQKVVVTVARNDSVDGFIKSKLAGLLTKTSALAIDVILKDQYKVESVGGSHDRTMATGASANPGQVGRDPKGIPNYTAGSGNLEKALNTLAPPASAVNAPPKSAPTLTPPPDLPTNSDAGSNPADAGPVGTGPDEEDG